MEKTIVQIGNEALRTQCTPIDLEKIKTPETEQTITDLLDTLAKETDGVGLSAPQIGVTQRIFVISHKAFYVEQENPKKAKNMVFINPKITKTSHKKEWMEEGCLSIRWVYGQVERYKQVTVEFYDEDGNKQSRGFSGFLSHVVQHEFDHLDGVLFIDIAKDIHELSPEEIAQVKRESNG